jgi:hypothetical protein
VWLVTDPYLACSEACTAPYDPQRRRRGG